MFFLPSNFSIKCFIDKNKTKTKRKEEATINIMIEVYKIIFFHVTSKFKTVCHIAKIYLYMLCDRFVSNKNLEDCLVLHYTDFKINCNSKT